MEQGIKYLLAAFITLTLGIALLGVYADQNVNLVSKKPTTETYTLQRANATTGEINESYLFYPTYLAYSSNWRHDESTCSVSTLTVKNGTGTTLTNNGCASGGDYVYVTDVSLKFCNSAKINGTAINTTTVTYNYCPDNYIASSFGRGISNIAVGLFALMLLCVAVGFMYMAYKEWGLDK